MAEVSESFGSRLRRLRVAAAFTQERLAERAGISPGGIAALERGRHRTPRLSTVRLLAEALELNDSDRTALAAAAAPATEPDQATERRSSRTRLPARVLAPMASPVRRHGFVGREKDLARLRAAWGSRVGLVLVSGEAGVGKSRLASEFGRQAHDQGATTLWGRCTAEHLGAFEPFVDVTRHVVRHLDDDRLSAALGGRGDLARLAPELADRLPGLPAPSHADAGTDLRLLF